MKTSIVSTQKIIVIELKDWEGIYYKKYDPSTFKLLIEQWNARKPIELWYEHYISWQRVQMINTRMSDEVLWFIATQRENKKQLLDIYNLRIANWKQWNWIDHFISALQTRWITISKIEETTDWSVMQADD